MGSSSTKKEGLLADPLTKGRKHKCTSPPPTDKKGGKSGCHHGWEEEGKKAPHPLPWYEEKEHEFKPVKGEGEDADVVCLVRGKKVLLFVFDETRR